MIKTKITIGTGFGWLYDFIVEIEEWENEQDAIDKLIDELEAHNDTGFFIKNDELHSYSEDVYITGGNHGLNLLHYGILFFEEVFEEI